MSKWSKKAEKAENRQKLLLKAFNSNLNEIITKNKDFKARIRKLFERRKGRLFLFKKNKKSRMYCICLYFKIWKSYKDRLELVVELDSNLSSDIYLFPHPIEEFVVPKKISKGILAVLSSLKDKNSALAFFNKNYKHFITKKWREQTTYKVSSSSDTYRGDPMSGNFRNGGMG